MTQNSLHIEHVSQNLAKRKAGRPKANQLQGVALKEHVISAAGLVYGEFGYHECSVDKIAKAAGISRPLFYRLYESKEQILNQLVLRINKQLEELTRNATKDLNDFFQIIDASIDAYFRWCLDNKQVVRSIYREINDLQTPAGKHYQSFLYNMLHTHLIKLAQVNVNSFRPELILALTKAVEFCGNAIIQPGNDNQQTIDTHRAIARRIVFASLSSEDQASHIPELQTVLTKG